MGRNEIEYGKRKIIYLETGSTDPYYNLAFEEYVLTHKTEGDYLILWQNDNTIVIGQNQNTEAEINAAFVEEHSINVVRRTTGGGAVYHDLGNLNYSFITDVGDAEGLSIKWFTEPVVKALSGLGVAAEASGRNDIVVSGKKVSGTAQRIAGKRILHHGTLLFGSDPKLLAGALIVSLGDLLYVGIQCEHPGLFVLAACVNGICFTMINYALVFALDNIGLGLGVIILVLQVAGAVGTYPVEVLPPVFRALNPVMPFRYAMGAMKECVCGMYGDTYIKCIAVLGAFTVIAMIIGLVLYYPALKLNRMIAISMKKSDVMLG